ncbi:MAG: peptidylprolyl isomerase [Verrucomicrobiota bacterium]
MSRIPRFLLDGSAVRCLWMTLVLLVAAFSLSGCRVMKAIDKLPAIPDLVLIGDRKPKLPPEDRNTPPDRSNLVPDFKKNAAVFKVAYLGKTTRIVVQLFPEDAPVTVANFQYLVDHGYYDDLLFHRVIPNYLVQAGDPLTRREDQRLYWGTGGPSYTLPPEVRRRHIPGSVGMARLGDAVNQKRESNGSQFYFTIGDLKALDGKYTVFGHVIQGFAALEEMARLPADENDNPLRSIRIKSASLSRSSKFEVESTDAVTRSTTRMSPEDVPEKKEGVFRRMVPKLW